MPSIGDSVTCAETGRVFTIARDGCSYNYATSQTGEILSDIGVDLRQTAKEMREQAAEKLKRAQIIEDASFLF